MQNQLTTLARAGEGSTLVYRAEAIRTTTVEGQSRLGELLKEPTCVQICDNLEGQIRELIESRNPTRKFSASEISSQVQQHLGDVPSWQYGVWVYYPWSHQLVHILDEEEFAEVRTNRNRNKITEAESKDLSTKKVGVIGLSVGQSVALTLAMERTFGELRIADFDLIELSNLNRIRTGIHHLGTPKVVVVAREIAELDPFLKVTVFDEGITPENIDSFFDEGGTLDGLIEECDSLPIKVLARQYARERKIPVIMDTSDRGMIDIERFDLEPDRPILHGRLTSLQIDMAIQNELTPEQRRELIMAIIDPDQISQRMLDSMHEVGKTLCTWPQLASGVMLGGAVSAALWRLIVTNQSVPSGRFLFDIPLILDQQALPA